MLLLVNEVKIKLTPSKLILITDDLTEILRITNKPKLLTSAVYEIYLLITSQSYYFLGVLQQ